MKIIVVGAGIGGSAIARVARGRGHDVFVIASLAIPHSLAATAVLRRGYHKGEEQALWDTSMGFYRHWDIPLVSGAQVTNYRTPDKAPHHDKDWHLIDPAAPLVRPHLVDRVVSCDNGIVHTVKGVEQHADVVILAPGVAPFSPVGKITWGVTWVHPDPGVLLYPDGLQVHHWAPYKSIVAGPVGGTARLGSSSASKEDVAYQQGQHLLAAAWDIGMVNSVKGWSAQVGARLQTVGHIHHLAERKWWFGGFHRTGYALAPALALKLITALEPS